MVLRTGALLAALAACAPAEDGSTMPENDPRIVWSVQIPAPGNGVPLAVGDRVIMGSDSGVAAYAANDGALIWRTRVRIAGANRSLVPQGDRLFSAAVRGARAFDLATGALVWERLMPQEAALDATDAAADERALYIGTRDLRVLALDRESGQPLWDVRVPRVDWHSSSRQSVAGIVTSGDTVYAAVNRDLTVGAYESAVVLVAFDRATGRELWRYQTAGKETGTDAAPALAGSLLVVGGARDGHSVAVDRFTQREVWRRDLYGYVWETPVQQGNRIFLGTQAARLYAVDSATGRSVWETTLEGGSTYQAVCGDKLVVENYAVELFDTATGKKLGRKIGLSPGDFVSSGIAVAGNRAFFAGQQKLYAIRCD